MDEIILSRTQVRNGPRQINLVTHSIERNRPFVERVGHEYIFNTKIETVLLKVAYDRPKL